MDDGTYERLADAVSARMAASIRVLFCNRSWALRARASSRSLSAAMISGSLASAVSPSALASPVPGVGHAGTVAAYSVLVCLLKRNTHENDTLAPQKTRGRRAGADTTRGLSGCNYRYPGSGLMTLPPIDVSDLLRFSDSNCNRS